MAWILAPQRPLEQSIKTINQTFRHDDAQASKPLMEKRRRARINHCLAQLKSLIIDPNTTERSRQAKLEKADILELTVRHLHEIKRRQRTASLLDVRHPKRKFEIGYAECAREVDLFLSNLIDPQLAGVENELQQRLKDHLCHRLQDLKNIEPILEQKSEELSQQPSEQKVSEVPSSEQPIMESSDRNKSELHSGNDHKMLELQDIYYFKSEKCVGNPKKRYKNVDNTLQKRNMRDQCSKQSNVRIDSCESPTNFKQPIKNSDITSSSVISFSNNDQVLKTYETSPKSINFHRSVIKNSRTEALNYYFPKNSECSRDFSSDQTGTNSAIKKEHELTAAQNQRGEHRIQLIPRRLDNGQWALVLPPNMTLSENNISHPFSAFRLVMPPKSNSSDNILNNQQRHQLNSSPFSSTVSDLSTEEYNSGTDVDGIDRMDFNADMNIPQEVWRPW